MSTFAEKAAFVRTAALKAVEGLPGTLGESQIAQIIAQTTDPRMQLSMSDLLGRAADLAKTYVKDAATKPLNFIAATRAEMEAYRLRMGLPEHRDGNFAQRVADASNRSGGQGRNAQPNSANYDGISSAQAAANAWANPAFLGSVGLSGSTGRALAALGFKTEAQIRALGNDAERTGVSNFNAIAVDMAKLKKSDPKQYNDQANFFAQRLPHIQHLADLDRQIADEKDPAKRAALLQQKTQLQAKVKAMTDDARKHTHGAQGLKTFNAWDKQQVKDSKDYIEHARDPKRAPPLKTGAERKAELRREGGEREAVVAHAELKREAAKENSAQTEKDVDALVAGLTGVSPPDKPPTKAPDTAAPVRKADNPDKKDGDRAQDTTAAADQPKKPLTVAAKKPASGPVPV